MAELSILSQTAKRKFELDTDILDCPICQEPLASPVFQVLSAIISHSMQTTLVMDMVSEIIVLYVKESLVW